MAARMSVWLAALASVALAQEQAFHLGGDAVVFRDGKRYALRTHEGRSDREGEWREEDGWRVVESCCHTFRFKLRPEGGLQEKEQGEWLPGMPAASSGAAGVARAPVRLRVVDAESGAPVGAFGWSYSVSYPDGEEPAPFVGLTWEKGATGGVEIAGVPLSCKLSVELDAPGWLCHGSSYGRYAFDLKAGDSSREAVVRLPAGLTVMGRVLDEETGAPVAGAVVAPLVEYHPCERMNLERKCVTGEDGWFSVQSVEGWRGLGIEHARYGRHEIRGESDSGGSDKPRWNKVEGKPRVRTLVVRLKKAQKLEGVVRDAEGKPVAGAAVESDNGRRAVTDKDGRFTLYDAQAQLKVEAEGFADEWGLAIQEGAAQEIVLRRKTEIAGTVTDPQGKPLEAFAVALRDGYGEERRAFKGTQGAFSVLSQGPTNNMLIVSAEGFAPQVCALAVDRPKVACQIVMRKGARLSGRVLAPAGYAEKVSVELARRQPVECSQFESRFDYEESVASLFAKRADAGGDGSYELAGVSPGQYEITFAGPGLEPAVRMIGVGQEDRAFAPVSLKKQGAGTVQGRVCAVNFGCASGACPPPKAWPFKEGCLDHALARSRDDVIRFKADENGDYCVSNVPCGPVCARVSFNVTFDIVDAMEAAGEVAENQTLRLDVMPEAYVKAKRRSEATCGATFSLRPEGGAGAFARVLDGRIPVVILTREGQMPLWDSGEVRIQVTNLAATVTNLVAGRMKATFWLWSPERLDTRVGGEEVWESPTALELSRDRVPETAIPIASGVVTGIVTQTEYPWSASVWLAGKDKGGAVREVRSEEQLGRALELPPLGDGGTEATEKEKDEHRGAFRFSGVPAGEYAVYAHDETGFARQEVVVSGITAAAPLALREGARLVVLPQLDGVASPRDRRAISLTATHLETGIRLEPDQSDGASATFLHLWPGEWQVTLRAPDGESSRSCRIDGIESAEVTVEVRRTF